jgi:hypothetical protein
MGQGRPLDRHHVRQNGSERPQLIDGEHLVELLQTVSRLLDFDLFLPLAEGYVTKLFSCRQDGLARLSADLVDGAGWTAAWVSFFTLNDPPSFFIGPCTRTGVTLANPPLFSSLLSFDMPGG